MIDGSEKRNRQLAFELQNSHVCEKRSKTPFVSSVQRYLVGSVFFFFDVETRSYPQGGWIYKHTILLIIKKYQFYYGGRIARGLN